MVGDSDDYCVGENIQNQQESQEVWFCNKRDLKLITQDKVCKTLTAGCLNTFLEGISCSLQGKIGLHITVSI